MHIFGDSLWHVCDELFAILILRCFLLWYTAIQNLPNFLDHKSNIKCFNFLYFTDYPKMQMTKIINFFLPKDNWKSSTAKTYSIFYILVQKRKPFISLKQCFFISCKNGKLFCWEKTIKKSENYFLCCCYMLKH